MAGLTSDASIRQVLLAQGPMRFFDAGFDATPHLEAAISRPQLLGHVMSALAPRWEVTADPGSLTVPLFLAHGRHHYVVPWLLWDGIPARLPDATFQLFERSGHQPFFEEPDRFAATMANWFVRKPVDKPSSPGPYSVCMTNLLAKEAEMEIGDLERIRFVTRRFGELQGFRRLVPVGLLALGGAGLSSLTGWLLLLPAALFAGACLLFLGAGRYYRDTFGEVEPAAEVSSALLMVDGPAPRLQPTIPAVPRLLLVLGLTCGVFILFQLLLWPPWVTIGSEVVHWSGDAEMTRAMLIQMLYGLCGIFFLGTWWLRERRLSQSHHLGLGLLLSELAALGPWFVPAAVHFASSLLLCGASLILAGLLDHWQISRVLGGAR